MRSACRKHHVSLFALRADALNSHVLSNTACRDVETSKALALQCGTRGRKGPAGFWHKIECLFQESMVSIPGSRCWPCGLPGGDQTAGSPCAVGSGRAAWLSYERGTPVRRRARSIHQPDSWWFTVKKGAFVLPGELSHWPKHAHD